MFLLDINILIALADPDHVHRERAQSFFFEHHRAGWATCPITENGFIRIISHSSYLKGPDTPEQARDILRQICGYEGHRFWPDDVTLRDFPNLPKSKNQTDHYLLNLAIHRQGRFATMDERIDPTLVAGGNAAYLVI